MFTTSTSRLRVAPFPIARSRIAFTFPIIRTKADAASVSTSRVALGQAHGSLQCENITFSTERYSGGVILGRRYKLLNSPWGRTAIGHIASNAYRNRRMRQGGC